MGWVGFVGACEEINSSVVAYCAAERPVRLSEMRGFSIVQVRGLM